MAGGKPRIIGSIAGEEVTQPTTGQTAKSAPFFGPEETGITGFACACACACVIYEKKKKYLILSRR